MKSLKLISAFLAIALITNTATCFKIIFNGYSAGNITIEILSLENRNLESFLIRNNSINLNLQNGSYHIVVRYNGMSYFKKIEIPKDKILRINFERSKNLSSLIITDYHFVIDKERGKYVVIEMVKFKNIARSFFSGDIVKKLPPDSKQIAINENYISIPYENLSIINNTILIKNASIQPNGSFVLAYIYNTKNPEIIADYKIVNLSVIFPKNLKVKLPKNFSFQGEIKSRDGKIYYVYSAKDIRGILKIEISEERKESLAFLLVVIALFTTTTILYIVERGVKKEKEGDRWDFSE